MQLSDERREHNRLNEVREKLLNTYKMHVQESKNSNDIESIIQDEKEMNHIDRLNSQITTLTALVEKLTQKDQEEKYESKIEQEPIDINENDPLYLWLKDTVGLKQYYSNFIQNGFENLDDLELVTMDILNTNMGITKIGHRLKLKKCIEHRNQTSNSK